MKDYKRLTERCGNLIIDKCWNCPNLNEEQPCTEGKCHQNKRRRLAELEDKIESGELCEQKTCKNISEKNPVDEFICSECGFHYEDVSETREDEDGEYSYEVEFVTKYCPNCGAKVEDEE